MKQLCAVLLVMVIFPALCAAGENPEFHDQNEMINYSLGYQLGGDLKGLGIQVNKEAFVRGVQNAIDGTEPLVSPEEMKRLLVDLKTKVVENQRTRARLSSEKIIEEGRAFMAENAKKEGVTTLPSGLQYKIVREGAGTGKTPAAADTVTINYRSTLTDGTEFGGSYRDNKPASFRVNKVIPGLAEALLLMKEGAQWQLFIPPNLAYQERGPMEDRTVIMEVELLSVQPAPVD